jgi:ATP-dependent Clp protease ATP-binding subunit ClpA
MFERFHHNARAAVVHARDEATRLGQRAIGTEHLLLGLLARPGHAADALKDAGADAAGLRARLSGSQAAPAEPADAGPVVSAGGDPDSAGLARDAASAADSADQVGEEPRGGPGATGDMPMTRDAKRALEAALRTAQHLRHQYVSSGDLLLGVIDQPGSPAVQALTVAGIHVGTLRADVLRRIATGPDPGAR